LTGKKLGPIVLGAGLAGATALGTYILFIRPRILHWGATDDEIRRPLPGDDLVPHPRMRVTQAVTIHAPPARIWPWLVQIGYKRAGWYSHDWIHRLLGVAGCVDDDRRSAERIIPELQDLEVGDSVEVGPGMGYRVVGLEPDQAMILHINLDMGTWQSFDLADAPPEKYLQSSWSWVLDQVGKTRTRLVVRIQQDWNPGPLNTLMMRGLIEPGSFIMQRGSLLGSSGGRRPCDRSAGG